MLPSTLHSPAALPAEAGDIHGAVEGGGSSGWVETERRGDTGALEWGQTGFPPFLQALHSSKAPSGDSVPVPLASTTLKGCGCARRPFLGTSK